MKIVICMDSWKGSLSAREACAAVARGLRAVDASLDILSIPLADGGEGTLEVVSGHDPGERVRKTVCGPLPGSRVEAEYLLWPDRADALIEMAQCAGLPLLAENERDPMTATTYGVGELIADALDRGARRVRLAVGGSATVDGGSGMASALGWRFLDDQDTPLPPGGAALRRLHSVVPPETPFPKDLRVEVWCDVTNPLTGPQGAARIFGPQKGADPQQVEALEEALTTLAETVRHTLGAEIDTIPGAGAAGGLAAGAMAFLNARLVSGVDALAELAGLDAALESADWVITGEGSFDPQSLDGKLVSGVLKRAQQSKTRVAVLAGTVRMNAQELTKAGIEAFASANEQDLPLEEAMERAEELAEKAAGNILRNLL